VTVELTISLQVDIPLHAGDREDIADLRADGHDLRFKWTKSRQAAPVHCYLLIEILIVGRRVREVISKPRDERELAPGLLIEIGVAATRIDGTVTTLTNSTSMPSPVVLTMAYGLEMCVSSSDYARFGSFATEIAVSV
jgi:hypothetical protein